MFLENMRDSSNTSIKWALELSKEATSNLQVLEMSKNIHTLTLLFDRYGFLGLYFLLPICQNSVNHFHRIIAKTSIWSENVVTEIGQLQKN